MGQRRLTSDAAALVSQGGLASAGHGDQTPSRSRRAVAGRFGVQLRIVVKQGNVDDFLDAQDIVLAPGFHQDLREREATAQPLSVGGRVLVREPHLAGRGVGLRT